MFVGEMFIGENTDTSPEGWRKYLESVESIASVMPQVRNNGDVMVIFFRVLHHLFLRAHKNKLCGGSPNYVMKLMLHNARLGLKPIPEKHKSNYDKVVNELKETHKWAEERSRKAGKARRSEVFYSSIRPVNLHYSRTIDYDNDCPIVGYLTSQQPQAQASWFRPDPTDYTNKFGFTKKRTEPEYLFNPEMNTPALVDYFTSKLMYCMKDSFCNEREKLVMQEMMAGFNLLKRRYAAALVFTTGDMGNC